MNYDHLMKAVVESREKRPVNELCIWKDTLNNTWFIVYIVQILNTFLVKDNKQKRRETELRTKNYLKYYIKKMFKLNVYQKYTMHTELPYLWSPKNMINNIAMFILLMAIVGL